MNDDAASGWGARLGYLARVETGPSLACALAGVDPVSLGGPDLVEYVTAAHRLGSWAAACEFAALGELAHTPEGVCGFGLDTPERVDDIRGHVDDEVAVALRMSVRAAGFLVETGTGLRDRLPATAAALRSGAIDVPKATAVCETTSVLTPGQARTVEDHVLVLAPEQTRPQLKGCLRYAVIKADPHAFDKRRVKSVADRRVSAWPNDDGTSEFSISYAPTEAAEAAFAHVDALARAATAVDGRTLEQRRADVALDLLTGKATGARVTTNVTLTVPLTTLLGMTENPGAYGGAGPVTATVARRLLADAANDARSAWCVSARHDDGSIAHHARTAYRPTGTLRDFLTARDTACVFPSCTRPSERCDVDHTVKHRDGGTTCPCNTAPLCPRHHKMKDDDGNRWVLTQPKPGHYRWTTPTGHRYTTTPAPPDG